MLGRMWYKWNSNTLFVGLQGGKITLENSWQFLVNLNIHSSWDPAITLAQEKEVPICIHQKAHIQMFIAALCIIAQTENNHQVVNK